MKHGSSTQSGEWLLSRQANLDQIDWKEIVYAGTESDTLDYKAAQNWHKLSRSGKAKFARHCMALANTRGGYLVVGVGEDRAGRPVVYQGLSEEESKSFDPTDVGSFINGCSDPPIEFDLVRPVIDGKRYVIIVVHRFRDLPHVCRVGCDHELQQGVFYIRTPDASSRAAYRATEVHQLIQRALRNQREMLGRMIRGILYEKQTPPEPLAESLYHEELRNSMRFFEKNVNRSLFLKKTASLTWAIYPDRYLKSAFELSTIQLTMKEAVAIAGVSGMFCAEPGEFTYFTNNSLRSLDDERGVYYQAFRSGLWHGVLSLSPWLKESELPYADLVNLIARMVLFSAHYTTILGYQEEIIHLLVTMRGIDGLRIVFPNRPVRKHQGIARIGELEVRLDRSAADWLTGIPEHARRIIRDICIRFNVPDAWHPNIEEDVRQRLKGIL
ncbi:MAG: ATP-binding protein [Lentisphaerae bacterium]|nr:MAG: ATP-binding protein [Lentisphaerota bacterium]